VFVSKTPLFFSFSLWSETTKYTNISTPLLPARPEPLRPTAGGKQTDSCLARKARIGTFPLFLACRHPSGLIRRLLPRRGSFEGDIRPTPRNCCLQPSLTGLVHAKTQLMLLGLSFSRWRPASMAEGRRAKQPATESSLSLAPERFWQFQVQGLPKNRPRQTMIKQNERFSPSIIFPVNNRAGGPGRRIVPPPPLPRRKPGLYVTTWDAKSAGRCLPRESGNLAHVDGRSRLADPPLAAVASPILVSRAQIRTTITQPFSAGISTKRARRRWRSSVMDLRIIEFCTIHPRN